MFVKKRKENQIKPNLITASVKQAFRNEIPFQSSGCLIYSGVSALSFRPLKRFAALLSRQRQIIYSVPGEALPHSAKRASFMSLLCTTVLWIKWALFPFFRTSPERHLFQGSEESHSLVGVWGHCLLPSQQSSETLLITYDTKPLF